jgi:plasmid stabilization system protein ParE
MARVIVSSSANADIYAIEKDLAKFAGKPLAEKYSAHFKSLFNRLAEYPDSGAPRRGLGKDIRVGIVFPYVVIYQHRKADSTVIVLRVVHGHRNITAKLITD